LVHYLLLEPLLRAAAAAAADFLRLQSPALTALVRQVVLVLLFLKLWGNHGT